MSWNKREKEKQVKQHKSKGKDNVKEATRKRKYDDVRRLSQRQIFVINTVRGQCCQCLKTLTSEKS